MSIVIENLCKSFGTHSVLQSFCWTVDRPMVLMGASGCGKTTLLRILSGLETADSGTITGVVTPAVVFQEDRLCPQLTAVDNLVLTGHGLTAAQARSDLRSLGFTEADLRLLDQTQELVCPYCNASFDIELEGTEDEQPEDNDQ